MEYRLITYTPERKDGISELLTHLASVKPDYNRRYFEWKYEENPFIRTPIVSLVVHGEKIVGMRGLFGTRWKSPSGESIVVPHADDLVIHPEHRNRGLFVLIDDHLSRLARNAGYSHIISLSGGGTTQQISLATGWVSVGEIERLYRPSLAGRVPGASGIANTIRRTLRRLRKRTPSVQPSPEKRLPTDEEIDAVVSQFGQGADRSIEVLKTVDPADISAIATRCQSTRLSAAASDVYYAWRLSNPDRRYRYVVWKSPELRGVAILSWSSGNARVIKVAQVISDDDDVAEELLRHVASHRRVGIEVMASTQTDTFVSRAMRRGYCRSTELAVPLRTRMFLLRTTGANPNHHLPPGLDEMSSWHLSMLDTMNA